MAILQFAFDSDLTNPFLPHNLRPRTVVYTGTHDNDTSWGWWGTAPEHERRLALDYLEVDGTDIAWDLIRAGWRSPGGFGGSAAGHPRPGDRGEDELPAGLQATGGGGWGCRR